MSHDYAAMREAALRVLERKVFMKDYKGAVVLCNTQLSILERRLSVASPALHTQGWLLIQGALLTKHEELLTLYAKHMPYSYKHYMKGGV